MQENTQINIDNLTKIYKLYNSPLDRIKESLNPFKKKYYREHFALNNVTFSVKKGRTLGIIGKNGSGKSTLLKIVCGIVSPSYGYAKVNGKIASLLELGAGFHPEMTGIENIYFNGTLMGYSQPEINERLNDIISFADIGEYISQPVKRYSSGMFVRLAFAVAINVDPEILIIDEALSVGDVKFQRKCYSKIEEFRLKNVTILFVSHDINAITNICDEAILLNNGLLIDKSEPKKIAKAYMSLMFDEQTKSGLQKHNSKQFSIYQNDPSSCLSQNELFNSHIKNKALNSFNLTIKYQSTHELRHGNIHAEIIDFGICNKKHEYVSSLILGESYIFYFYAVFYKQILKPFVGFIIRNVHGVELFWTNNEMIDINMEECETGSLLKVELNIVNWLAPDNYFLSFVLRDANSYEALDRRLDAKQFVVISNNKNIGGFVNLQPLMTVSKINLAENNP